MISATGSIVTPRNLSLTLSMASWVCCSSFKHTKTTIMAPHIPQAPLRIDDHLAHTHAFGWEWKRAHLPGLWLQVHERIRSKLVGPHHPGAIHRHGIGPALRATWQDVGVDNFCGTWVNMQQF